MISTNTLDNAKKFDNDFIKHKHQNIYCGSETLIIDYLLIKSASTSNLKTIIMCSANPAVAIETIKDLNTITKAVGLDYILSKHNKSNSYLKFKNKSKIYCYSSSDNLSITNMNIDIIYIRNMALPYLFYSQTNMLDKLCSSLAPTGRIIYNFSR